MRAQEFVLAQSRCQRRLAGFEFYARHRVHQAKRLARDVMRIGVLVAAEPNMEIGGLPNIQQTVRVVEHEIHAGARWDGLEEISAKSRQQRLGMFEQAKLSLRHFYWIPILDRQDNRFPYNCAWPSAGWMPRAR